LINNFVRSMFEGIKEARSNNYSRKFSDLNMVMDCWIGNASTRLLEVDELNDLFNHATTKEQHESILDHMYRFDATRVGYYKQIEKKIINQYWEE
jgi:hypothetical protein